jgi:hypothetical protein
VQELDRRDRRVAAIKNWPRHTELIYIYIYIYIWLVTVRVSGVYLYRMSATGATAQAPEMVEAIERVEEGETLKEG